MPKFYAADTRSKNIFYYRTDLRPSDEEMNSLRKTAKTKRGKKHKPGDGWHYVPGRAEFWFNSHNWFVSKKDSAGAILSHAQQVCAAYGLDLRNLYKAAYPDEEEVEITPKDIADCSRPANKYDLEEVLNDLESINYHSLLTRMRDAIEALEA